MIFCGKAGCITFFIADEWMQKEDNTFNTQIWAIYSRSLSAISIAICRTLRTGAGGEVEVEGFCEFVPDWKDDLATLRNNSRCADRRLTHMSCWPQWKDGPVAISWGLGDTLFENYLQSTIKAILAHFFLPWVRNRAFHCVLSLMHLILLVDKCLNSNRLLCSEQECPSSWSQYSIATLSGLPVIFEGICPCWLFTDLIENQWKAGFSSLEVYRFESVLFFPLKNNNNQLEFSRVLPFAPSRSKKGKNKNKLYSSFLIFFLTSPLVVGMKASSIRGANREGLKKKVIQIKITCPLL